MNSAISPRGESRFQIVEGSINGARFIAFLATLLDKSLKFMNGLTQWLEKVRACFRHPATLYAVS